MKRLLRVLDQSGDTRIEFDLESKEGLADAQAAWDKVVSKGGSAFSVTPGTSDAVQRLTSLDEASQETILISPITAG